MVKSTISASIVSRKSLQTILEEAGKREIEIRSIDTLANGHTKVRITVRPTDDPGTLAAFARSIR